MPWKQTDDKHMALDTNGNPVFVLDTGEEKSVDYPAMIKALSIANREAAERKAALREAEDRLKVFDGIEDVPDFIAKAKRNAETVAALGEKEKDAEEAARARVAAAIAPLEKQLAELKAEKDRITGDYHASVIRAQFGLSRFVADELADRAMAEELFARHFSVDNDGKLVAKDAAGNVIYDENGPAGFDAAMRKIVAQSPYADFVRKGSRATGSGSQGGSSGQANGKVVSRAEFDRMPPAERAKFFREGGTIGN